MAGHHPAGIAQLSVTGGEPTLRKDLGEVVDVLCPKARVLEIGTNRMHANRLLPIIEKYPDVKIRISIEGSQGTDDRIRGEKGGHASKLATMTKLIEAGGRNLEFAATFQDENIEEVVDMYRMSRDLNVEFATSALHNGFQLHKNDNYQHDRPEERQRLPLESPRYSQFEDGFHDR